jgi:hypothetical protein
MTVKQNTDYVDPEALRQGLHKIRARLGLKGDIDWNFLAEPVHEMLVGKDPESNAAIIYEALKPSRTQEHRDFFTDIATWLSDAMRSSDMWAEDGAGHRGLSFPVEHNQSAYIKLPDGKVKPYMLHEGKKAYVNKARMGTRDKIVFSGLIPKFGLTSPKSDIEISAVNLQRAAPTLCEKMTENNLGLSDAIYSVLISWGELSSGYMKKSAPSPSEINKKELTKDIKNFGLYG